MMLAPGDENGWIGVSDPREVYTPTLTVHDGKIQLRFGGYLTWKAYRDVEVNHVYIIGPDGTTGIKVTNPSFVKKGKKFTIDDYTVDVVGHTPPDNAGAALR